MCQGRRLCRANMMDTAATASTIQVRLGRNLVIRGGISAQDGNTGLQIHVAPAPRDPEHRDESFKLDKVRTTQHTSAGPKSGRHLRASSMLYGIVHITRRRLERAGLGFVCKPGGL